MFYSTCSTTEEEFGYGFDFKMAATSVSAIDVNLSVCIY